MKTCVCCGDLKPKAEFYRNCKSADGLQSWCKHCVKSYNEKRDPPDPVNVRRSKIKYKYGLTLEQLMTMLVEQDYKCAICGDEVTASSHIDHDHETGKVRGVLCPHCNKALGYFRDNTAFLESAIQYLNNNTEVPNG